MDNLLPTTLRYRFNGITFEICHGEIPDIFRQLRYDPVTEFELPDPKATDDEFQEWLTLYRHAKRFWEFMLFEESQCN